MSTFKSIYFMKPKGASGPIKIGCSKFTGQRLIDLSLWSPIPLEIMAEGPGEHLLERCLHRVYRAQRSHGEWFFPSSDLLIRIARVRAGEDVATVFEAVPVSSSKWGGICRYWSSLEARATRQGEAAA